MPTDVLCRAVKDVVGLDFDASKPQELAAARLIVDKLVDNAQLAGDLASSIARQSRPAEPGHDTLLAGLHNARLRTAPARMVENDPAADDYPAESSVELGLAPAVAASANTYTPEDWDILSALDKAYVTVSPERLGFHPLAIRSEWGGDIESKWFDFLARAEQKVGSRTGHTRWLLDWWRKDYATTAKQAGKNYGIWTLEAGPQKAAAHFIFDPGTLYVLVIKAKGEESRFAVPVDNVDDFTANLVQAFEGHEDYAKLVLNSMTKLFAQ
ncbi:hypothetical protein [Massilia endophytica]|uniref:hypothetical protein n=1 Tax=Massilia endophytica TaxID=2899220 RepID=UPI001E305D55|nr:hypothetical protein [Massilia endophytica]UGQ47826.1 hypothetical protein LSQ66_04975 [Massilia endophytica]